MQQKKKVFSWNIINDKILEKEIDKTFLLSGVTGIPIELRHFFDVQNENKKEITLWYKNKQCKAFIEYYGKNSKRTRMISRNLLRMAISPANSYDKISFEKIDSNNYVINFYKKTTDIVENLDFETKEIIETKEGKKIQLYTTKYERCKKNRDAAIKIHGYKCEVCGFDFFEFYGCIGKDFIEVHHTKPLFSLNDEVIIDPETDLCCLCSNCHRIIHRNKGKVLTVEELKKILKEKKSNDLFR